MAMLEVEIKLTVTLRSAMHIGTGFGLAQLIDDRIVQGPHPDVPGEEFPYIPGSSLKGRLRHHTRELTQLLFKNPADMTAIEGRLFGYDHTPGLLRYCNSYLDPLFAGELSRLRGGSHTAVTSNDRTFVSLSRERRVALEQRLFRIEVAESGLQYSSRIHGYLPVESALGDLGLLVAAMKMVTNLGGHKGRGLGDCEVNPGEAVLRAADSTSLLQSMHGVLRYGAAPGSTDSTLPDANVLLDSLP